MTPAAASRSLRLYAWYMVGASVFAWMPIFSLYFLARVSLAEALALEALYYASVVAFEVPSGYLADRLGRRRALVVASALLVAAYGVFCWSDGLAGLALAQVLLAAGLAGGSGTDTSYHLACLEAAGRAEAYGEREASLGRLALLVGAASALAGGALSLVSMRLAYALSGAGALVALVAMLLSAPAPAPAPAPDASQQGEGEAAGFAASLRACAALARGPALRWLLAATVLSVVLNHLPYELYQPYLKALGQQRALTYEVGRVALVAGAHMAAAQLLGALVAGWSVAIARRLGLRAHLLLTLVGQGALVASMALWLHPVVAALLVLRGVPGALQRAPLRAATTPRVPDALRSTYLSLQSLAARLVFALVLVGLAAAAPLGLPWVFGSGAACAAALIVAMACWPRHDEALTPP